MSSDAAGRDRVMADEVSMSVRGLSGELERRSADWRRDADNLQRRFFNVRSLTSVIIGKFESAPIEFLTKC